MKHRVFALAVLLCAGCSGGGGSTAPAVPTPAATATATASAAPQSTHVVFTAPLGSNPALTPSSSGRRAQGIGSAPKTLVESNGAPAIWGGNFVVWVTDSLSGNDVAETSSNTSTTNGLLVDNPGITALNCGLVQTSSPWCAAHPLAWYFGTDSGLVKPVGKQTITVTFGDGASAQFTDFVYPSMGAACGKSYVVQAAGLVLVTSGGDVTYDCVDQEVIFPNGYVLASQPTADAYGRAETVFPTITAAVAVPIGSPTILPFASVVNNAVYVTRTTDGAFAKVYMNGGPGGATLNGMVSHSQADGSFAY